MGGRGSYSATYASNVLGFKNNDTLKEAIGEKGEPLSPHEAMSGANPFFDKHYEEFSGNCQRCVVAYELRRRGYDVTAQATFDNDKLPFRVDKFNSDGSQNAYWMGAFQNAKPIAVGTRNYVTRKEGIEKTISNIEKKMRKFGDGSRAIIQFKTSKSGHVFSVENVKGVITYMDPQVGKYVIINKMLEDASISRTQVIRTDNLRISERAKDCVTTRKR